jgi:membrane protein DedA with SNARE-associated domain
VALVGQRQLDGVGSRKRVDARRAKNALLALAGVRTALSLIALPLAPFLLHEHFLVLVLLRPSQLVLFVGAVLARRGDVNLFAIIVAALPLQLLVVWLYFALGKRWEREIESDSQLPFLATRVLRPDQIRRLRKVVRKGGPRFVALARFALFPTGLLAATAGASDMKPRNFFVADGAALAVAIGSVVSLGYVLGFDEHRGKVWIAVAGFAGLLILSAALTLYLSRAGNAREGTSGLAARFRETLRTRGRGATAR